MFLSPFFERAKTGEIATTSDEKAQEEFKKDFPEKVGAILTQRDPEDSRPVAILAQDEGIFGRINPHRPCWAPRGIRPKAPRQIVRAFVVTSQKHRAECVFFRGGGWYEC